MPQTENPQERLRAQFREAEEKLRDCEERYQGLMDQVKALHWLRAEVWRMRQVKDLSQVLFPIGFILTSREVSFLAYSINIVDDFGGEFPIRVYIHDPEGRPCQATLKQDQAATRIILDAWKSGKVLYRPDLAMENTYGEHLQPQPHPLQVRSAIDIPFSCGTLALASARPEAFSKGDIAFLEDIAQVVEEGFNRVEDLQAMERALRQEKALGRIREQIIALRGLGEMSSELEKEWAEELQGLGVPAHSTSLQFPVEQAGYFASFGITSINKPYSATAPMAEYPWVKEAWESGRPVIVDRQRLNQAGFDKPIGTLIELPLSCGGSLGVSSKEEHAFDNEAVHTLEQFAGLLALGVQRLRDFETLRQAEEDLKVDLALQRVRNIVLQMEGEQDWGKVVGVFGKELERVAPFYHCGINFVDLEKSTVRCFMVRGEGLYRETNEDTGEVSLIFRKVLETGRSLYRPRRTDPLFDPDIPAEVNSVVDVPFLGGTVAINSTKEDAFSARDIQILERFAQVLSEALRRLEDLKALALREQQLAQLQKLEALGQLATGVAHEINNPLTAVVGYSELMLRKELDPQRRERLEIIHQEGLRAARIIEQLLNFSRRQRADKQRTGLNTLVEELLALVCQQFALDQVQLSAELAATLPLVEVHPGQFQQVLLGLLQNSREAITQTHKSGAVTVRTCQQGEWVRLEVEDDGPGIPEALRERIFEPFFTTKEVGKGPGLGLSICHTIAQEHGGRLWAAPREQGACLVLELPVGGSPY